MLVRLDPDEPLSLVTMASRRHVARGSGDLRRLPATYLQQPAVQYEHALVLLNLAKLYAHTDRPEQHRVAVRSGESPFRAAGTQLTREIRITSSIAPIRDRTGGFESKFGPAGIPPRPRWTKALSSSEELARAHPANGYYRHMVADVAYSLASLTYHERHRPAEDAASCYKKPSISSRNS